MCGIFSIINGECFSHNMKIETFNKGKHRGPDNSALLKIEPNCLLGFHRLSINGLNDNSNQPIEIDDVVLICNGEIYNYKKIYKDLNISPKTESDCEVIIHLYKKYGIENTIQMLDGVFAFILVDKKSNNIYIARDPFGVRPLYKCSSKNSTDNIFMYASEIKSVYNLYKYISIYKRFKLMYFINNDIFIISICKPPTYLMVYNARK